MPDLTLNALFGDGCATVVRSGNVALNFSSTCHQLIQYKASLLSSNVHSRYQDPKAYGKKLMHFTTGTVNNFCMDKAKRIQDITMADFILWYLDDGSYHKSKHYMNLCSHALGYELNIILQEHLLNKLGIKTTVTSETKKDGRVFYYLYISTYSVKFLKPLIEKFIYEHNITDMLYKIGKSSETIEIVSTN
jgi:LAGLIDADG DNA endonuclease family